MKSVKTFAYMMAVAVVSTMGMVSCKDKEEPAQQGQGSYNGETVKSEFSISLPSQALSGAPDRRMPGTTVQLKDGEGVPQFQGMKSMTLVPYAKASDVVSGDIRLGDNISLLPNITSASELGTNSKAKLFPDVSIPMTTATFLFYAESGADGYQNVIGSLKAENLDNSHNAADFTFALERIASTSPTGTGTIGEQLMNYLTSIANAADGSGKKWCEYASGDDVFMAAQFAEFKRWHSLSSFAIARGLSDLYNTLSSSQFSTNSLATAIKAAIANTDDYVESVSGTPYVVTLKSTLTGFPEDLGLPNGAVRIKYVDDSKAFQACVTNDYKDAGNAPLESYVYPSSLWYYANSQIKTSNSSKQAFYNSTNDWAYILGQHTDATAVNSLTRAVAIEDVIQYAVARLDVKVKLKNSDMEDKEGNTVSCPNTGFELVGVLVGGQKNVGFNFTPKGETIQTIYDNVMTGGPIKVKADDYSAANSTLVLETAAGTGNDVQIAIEMLNNSGVDFVGADGVIPAGGKFYLVASLDAEDATETDQKVFKQDYTTIARLTIKNFKNAYNTIPDLRTPQMELGISVDLEWQAGHTYNIEIGG